MCGITGWVDWQEDLSKQHELVTKMTDTMFNRGPDAGGVWLSPHAAFGHRRLAVIDLDGGTQPMIREVANKKYVLTYSGEIYNYLELRKELRSRGHQFQTESDTEVLLLAYIEWGLDFVHHLNGIFAFGIWDDHQQELILVRDRLGVKPLYYFRSEHALLFGSEPKAILANPLAKAQIDQRGISQLFSMIHHTPGRSLFKDIDEVKAGHFLRFRRSGMETHQYWQLISQPHTDTEAETIEHIKELLNDIIRRQLIADVPVCTLLSGGIDSSAVTALAANILKEQQRDIHTFSVDYKDSQKHFVANDIHTGLDSPWVKVVSDHIHSKHNDVILDTPDILDHFLTPLFARDLPSMGDMDTSIYLLFKEIKKKATVALSGESSDELFGGYPWFFSPEAIEGETFPWLYQKQNINYIAPHLQGKINQEEYIRSEYQEALTKVPHLDGETGSDRRMRELFYLNITRFLPVLLDRKDRMSMATGLEVRVPFCDHRLVEYVWNIPWQLKTTGGIEKGILRKAVEQTLPHEVVYRKKSAYPSTYNPSYAQEIRRQMEHIIAQSHSPVLELVDKQQIQKAMDDTRDHLMSPLSQGPTRALAYLVQVNKWLTDYNVQIAL